MKLYLVLYNNINGKTFKKYFSCEFEMDKFIRKLKYSNKLQIVKDSREDIYDYKN